MTRIARRTAATGCQTPLIVLGLLAGAFLTVPAFAEGPGVPLPFPRSERAQSVWASGACWTECSASCTWGQAACLDRAPGGDSQGLCIKRADDCDRACQRRCRASGGPLLPLDF